VKKSVANLDKYCLTPDNKGANLFNGRYAVLENEQAYFEAHKSEIRKKYPGKRIVISGDGITGAYNTDGEAYAEAVKTMAPGTFMIKPVTQTDEEATRRYMNRVYD
jgi:hypothetical protein